MNTEPEDLDRRSLASCIDSSWPVGIVSLEYAPVGFGAHHYIARATHSRRWFVTVDEIATKTWLGNDPSTIVAGLKCALRAAVALRQSGLSFVHAPLESRTGATLARLDTKYVVSLYEYIDGTPGAFGVDLPPADRRTLFAALGKLHTSIDVVPIDLHSDAVIVPLRDELTTALQDLDREWATGPYGELTRNALAEASTDLRRALEAFDELVRRAEATAGRWVVTHGEPHGGNIMRTKHGELILIDWDTVAVGPAERDLAVALPRDDEEWSAYRSSGASTTPDPGLIRLYQQLWMLSDVSLATNMFRQPHEDSADTQVAWRGLRAALKGLAAP